ncbi:MAG: phosphotransferase [Candidatus Zixiibacteriota bacterium]|nr:MAG: phosphotransferase [candidate division Zixibacteria bacterium]
MVDIHTHVLPDLDDGPGTVEESLDLARAAWEAGTRTIVATPHVLNLATLGDNSLIYQRFEEFRATLQAVLPELNLVLGSEIYFQPHLSDYLCFPAATLNNTRRYMLVEFSLGDIPRGWEREIAAMRKNGVIPVLAHPERNAVVIGKPALVGKMVAEGALIQMNAGSLTGQFGSAVKKVAQILLRKGWVHVIASDSHSAEHRGPDLRKAVDVAAGEIGAAAAGRLVQENPWFILKGGPWPGL